MPNRYPTGGADFVQGSAPGADLMGTMKRSTQPVIILARPQPGRVDGCVFQRDARTGWRPCNQIAQLPAANEAEALELAKGWARRRKLTVQRVGPAQPDPTPLCPCGMCADGAVTCTGCE
jgi:hypothetical protein